MVSLTISGEQRSCFRKTYWTKRYFQNPEENDHDKHTIHQVGFDGPRLKDGTPLIRGSFSIPRSHKIPATKENQQQENQDSDLLECLYTIQDMQEMEEQIYLSAQKNAKIS